MSATFFKTIKALPALAVVYAQSQYVLNFGMYSTCAGKLRLRKKIETLPLLFETSAFLSLCYATSIRHRQSYASNDVNRCQLSLLLTGIGEVTMAQQHNIQTRPLDPQIERMIRFSLRAMGVFALAVCLLFWLSLLWR